MKTLKINSSNLKRATEILQSGGVVIYPTETAYGMAADPFNEKAVKKVYQIKGRDSKKRLPIIADSLKTVERFFILNKKERLLAQKFWPGPLTIILSLKHFNILTFKKIKIFNHPEPMFIGSPVKTCHWQLLTLKGGDSNIAVRISSNKIAQELAKSLGGLVISTSANVSGSGECYSTRAVVKQFKNRKFQPDIILDDGVLKKSKPSTIVAIEKGKIKIIRQGKIEVEQ